MAIGTRSNEPESWHRGSGCPGSDSHGTDYRWHQQHTGHLKHAFCVLQRMPAAVGPAAGRFTGLFVGPPRQHWADRCHSRLELHALLTSFPPWETVLGSRTNCGLCRCLPRGLLVWPLDIPGRQRHRPQFVNRHPRRRRCLFACRASASCLYHPQATKNSRSLRSQASRQTFLLCLDVHQGRSSAHAEARGCGAWHDCGNPDAWNSFALASTSTFSYFLWGFYT